MNKILLEKGNQSSLLCYLKIEYKLNKNITTCYNGKPQIGNPFTTILYLDSEYVKFKKKSNFEFDSYSA